MISASTLSCYSAFSSRILTTNHLITFLTLLPRYPVLQPINTYYSLIGAVYVFGLCALFSPRISSPSLSLYYLHVFPISRNCLAPPQFPESPHRAFIHYITLHFIWQMLYIQSDVQSTAIQGQTTTEHAR